MKKIRLIVHGKVAGRPDLREAVRFQREAGHEVSARSDHRLEHHGPAVVRHCGDSTRIQWVWRTCKPGVAGGESLEDGDSMQESDRPVCSRQVVVDSLLVPVPCPEGSTPAPNLGSSQNLYF